MLDNEASVFAKVAFNRCISCVSCCMDIWLLCCVWKLGESQGGKKREKEKKSVFLFSFSFSFSCSCSFYSFYFFKLPLRFPFIRVWSIATVEMSDEEYIIRREVVEEDEEEVEGSNNDTQDNSDPVFENEFRILIIANTNIVSNEDGVKVDVEESDMEEILVRQVKTIDDVNEFFDNFDKSIAEPNDGHLKYEVGSDGLCVVLVDTLQLKQKTVEFVQAFINAHTDSTENIGDSTENNDKEDSDRNVKRRK